MASTKIPLTLCLDPYEITLLDAFAEIFEVALTPNTESDAPDVDGIQDVFSRWLLYRKVKDNFNDIARQAVVREDWGGDVKHAFGMFLHFIQYYQFDFLYFRTTRLKEDNPCFLQALLELDDLKDVELDISPPNGDLKYWFLILKLFHDNEYGVADSDDLLLMDLLVKMRRPVVSRSDLSSEFDNEPPDVSDGWETMEEGQGGSHTPEAVTQTTEVGERNDNEMQGADPELTVRSNPKPGSSHNDDRSPLNTGAAEDVDTEMADLKLQEKSEDGDETDDDEPYIPLNLWSLIRKSSILRRRSENNTLILRFMEENGFFDFYAPIPGNLFCRDRDPQLWLSGINARITHLALVHHLARWGFNYHVIEDPRQFLEYVPWGELSFPDLAGSKETKVAVWNRRYLGLKFEHHLFTEEEVFRYCVMNDFIFPGHFQDSRIAFELTEVGKTKFVEEISQYWERWSDCAVSQNKETGEWYLLETRPGKKFRQIWDSTDRQAALNYFRNLVDAQVTSSRAPLEKELGLRYKPEYENLLRLIPFNEFHFDPRHKPMYGSRGVVYRATWMQRRRVAQPPIDSVEVILKAISAGSEEERDEIFKELDLNFKALQGTVVNVAKLYGVTRAPALAELPDELDRQIASRTLIVSECALLGSCWKYLLRNLTGVLSDWHMILLFIWGLASGLNVLHSKGVLHRDLHWGNLLVTTNKDQKELLTSVKSIGENVEILIADLGEGKLIGQSSTLGRRYGPAIYRAPEINYTAASDMYSVGMLVGDIVEAYLMAATKNDASQQMVPRALQELIEKLKDRDDPRRRPTAKEASKIVSGLWSNATHNYDFNPKDLDLVQSNSRQQMIDDSEIPFD